MMNLKYLNEIFLPVTDLQTSSHWYKEHFRMIITNEDVSSDRNTVKVSFKNSSFILVKSLEINKYSHIPFNFHTNRIRELHQSLKQAGVVVTQITEDDNMLCCDFYDPDGNRIGLCEESNDHLNQTFEVGGTFLTVRNLDKAVEWYQNKLGYLFHYFNATGAAGYIGETPEYVPDLTIRYAGVEHAIFESSWSSIALVETPDFFPLSQMPYNLYSSNANEDYSTLRNNGVILSDLHDDGNQFWFTFDDLDGNMIGVVQNKLTEHHSSL